MLIISKRLNSLTSDGTLKLSKMAQLIASIVKFIAIKLSEKTAPKIKQKLDRYIPNYDRVIMYQNNIEVFVTTIPEIFSDSVEYILASLLLLVTAIIKYPFFERIMYIVKTLIKVLADFIVSEESNNKLIFPDITYKDIEFMSYMFHGFLLCSIIYFISMFWLNTLLYLAKKKEEELNKYIFFCPDNNEDLLKKFSEFNPEHGETCPICMADFTGTALKHNCCSAFYHRECITTWSKRSKYCPYCRQ